MSTNIIIVHKLVFNFLFSCLNNSDSMESLSISPEKRYDPNKTIPDLNE